MITNPCVAPLAGSVDRNWTSKSILVELDVAPLAGSVDRNAGGVIPEVDGQAGRSPRGERG